MFKGNLVVVIDAAIISFKSLSKSIIRFVKEEAFKAGKFIRGEIGKFRRIKVE